MSKMTKAEKARALMYKKAVLQRINYYDIRNELDAIAEECDSIRYSCFDDDSIVNALDGDEDDAHEFRMLFSDLSCSCERLYEILGENYVSEYFDDIFVSMLGDKYKTLGYDGYEEDYFALTSYENNLAQTEAGKRVMRLSKAEMISAFGQAMGAAICFFDVSQKYDYLKATFDILKDNNTSHLQVIKDIETAYSKAADDNFNTWGEATREFDKIVASLPDITWIE